MRTPLICHAPEFVIEDLLRAEGFTDIRYIEGVTSAEINQAVTSGTVDFNTHFAPQWVSLIDGGDSVTVLSGVHVGCFELFGNASIRSITDLKSKTVGVAALGASDHLFVSVMTSHFGLDPANDIHWVASESPTPAELFADGKIDACLGLPPVPPRRAQSDRDCFVAALLAMTCKFYALRLHDTGLIKTTPTKIIAENTDWRFFNELKRELKA